MKWPWQRKPKPVVIGWQLAEARARETALRRTESGPSPMPPGRYEDYSLIDPRPGAFDEAIRRFCEGFVSRPAGVRNALTMDDFYQLLAFASRAAVFAIRDGSERWIADGLTATAVVDDERIDARDLSIPLSLLHYAALRIGADARALFSRAAGIATSSVGQRMRGQVKQSPALAEVAEGMMKQEIATAAGAGFVDRDLSEYHPSRDLLPPALAIREMLQRDHYAVESVAVASDVPDVWFASPAAAAPLLEHVTGAVTINAVHRADTAQIAMAFLAELDDAARAAELASLASHAQHSDTAMVAAAEGAVFCLLVFRSFVRETPSLETTASIQRFAEPLRGILRSVWARQEPLTSL